MDLVEKVAAQVPGLVVLYAVVRSFLNFMRQQADNNNALLGRMHEDCQRSSNLGREAVEKNTISNLEASANVKALVDAIKKQTSNLN